jgi:hypothetical protein
MTMAKTSSKPAKSKDAKPRNKPLPKAKPGEVTLLSGGNPQIAKGYGDAPVQAYIAAMPGWKSAVGRRLDTPPSPTPCCRGTPRRHRARLGASAPVSTLMPSPRSCAVRPDAFGDDDAAPHAVEQFCVQHHLAAPIADLDAVALGKP